MGIRAKQFSSINESIQHICLMESYASKMNTKNNNIMYVYNKNNTNNKLNL